MISLTEHFSSKELRRFGRFLAVGALGTMIDFNLLMALKLLGAPTLLANSLSFTAGLFNNYFLNSRWTFAEQANNWKLQLPLFTLVSIFGLVINNTIVLLLEAPMGNLIGQPDWGYLPAKVIATGVVVFWNYFANRYWTFATPIQQE